jgi:hypothetical protein
MQKKGAILIPPTDMRFLPTVLAENESVTDEIKPIWIADDQ